MGVKIAVKTSKGKSVTFSRWGNEIKDDHVSFSPSDIIKPTIIDTTTWRDWYTEYMDQHKIKLENWYKELQASWITSVNNVKPLDGRFFIIGGRCVNIDTSVEGSIGLVLTGRNNSNVSISKPDYQSYINNIMRCQMCLLHAFNSITHKLMTEDVPYGTYLNYLGLQARWNTYTFSANHFGRVITTLESIIIDIGYKNTTCDTEIVTFDATLRTQDGDYLPIDQGGRLGTFIMAYGGQTEPKPTIELIRKERIGEGERATERDKDITDMTNCQCGNITWCSVTMKLKIELQPNQYTRLVVGTYRHPGNPTPVVRDEEKGTIAFLVDSSITVDGRLIEDVKDVKCYAPVLKVATRQQIGKTEEGEE